RDDPCTHRGCGPAWRDVAARPSTRSTSVTTVPPGRTRGRTRRALRALRALATAVAAVAVAAGGALAAAPATAAPAAAPASASSSSPQWLTGYWHNFDNGSVTMRLSEIPQAYNLVAIAFADNLAGTPGGITFNLASAEL